MKQDDICFNCGAPATTGDHIPPKKIFPPSRRRNLIKVRACAACNGGTKLDDEYFRDACLLNVDEKRFPDALAYSVQKINAIGNDPKKRGYSAACYKSLFSATRVSDDGRFLIEEMGREIDRERITRSIKKFVRGLYYHHYKERLVDDVQMTVFYAPELAEDYLAEVIAPLTYEPTRVIGDGAFRYKFKRGVQEPEASIWVLSFYERQDFIALTLIPTNTSEKA
jgi:hypothetical protein